jgi:hypothetical protein
MSRVLVVGVARSGTSWVGRVLGSDPAVAYVHEPDNPDSDSLARAGMRGQLLMTLPPGGPAPELEALWDVSFNGGWEPGAAATQDRLIRFAPPLAPRHFRSAAKKAAQRPAPKHVVVKSVRAIFLLPWLAARYEPEVVVLFAHPLNVLSSWVSLGFRGWPDGDHPALAERLAAHGIEPLEGASELEESAWAICGQTQLLLEQAAEHPEWHVTSHEEICGDATAAFKGIATAAGLDWTPETEAFIEDADRSGGSSYETRRKTADQKFRWRRLDAEQAKAGTEVIARFRASSPAFDTLMARLDDAAEAA